MQAPQGEIDNLYLWFGAHHTNDLMGVVVTFSIPRLYLQSGTAQNKHNAGGANETVIFSAAYKVSCPNQCGLGDLGFECTKLSECCHRFLNVICKQPFLPTFEIYLPNRIHYATYYFPISGINLVLLHTSVFLQCILLCIYESSSN